MFDVKRLDSAVHLQLCKTCPEVGKYHSVRYHGNATILMSWRLVLSGSRWRPSLVDVLPARCYGYFKDIKVSTLHYTIKLAASFCW